MIYLAELFCAVPLLGAVCILMARVSPENLPRMEKLCRHRAAGLLIALPCTLLCVPLAVPVSPDFLVNWLFPLAAALPVLGYFHLDYYAARGFSFALILLAYDVIHGTFELHTPGAGAVTVLMLLQGIAGIWLSARPCTLRDLFRKAAASQRWKAAAAGCTALWCAAVLYVLIMTIGGYAQ